MNNALAPAGPASDMSRLAAPLRGRGAWLLAVVLFAVLLLSFLVVVRGGVARAEQLHLHAADHSRAELACLRERDHVARHACVSRLARFSPSTAMASAR